MRWPVPDSFEKKLPRPGMPGSFWEHRGDRYHCGVDIYAPVGSRVYAVEEGVVIAVGVFTSPEKVVYWNTTYFALIRDSRTGLIGRWSELGIVAIKPGEMVKAQQLIGQVGQVLNPAKISEDAPEYIRRLKQKGRLSMLHFELYAAAAVPDEIGASLSNAPLGVRPAHLLDPSCYFE